MIEKLYTTNEVAVLANVTPATIRKWIHIGKLNATKLPGGHVLRIKESELNKIYKETQNGTE